MLVYLSKKIAIPNQVRLHCISWNRDQGYIACGGEGGLLKVLKLETPSGPDAILQGVAASSNLSMNQTLEGHNGGVVCVTWNPIFRKLTTSDESGLIIVWIMHRGVWYEEMINNRNKSVVRDMKWTADGRKIAIVYEDGNVIVGSVDGNRLWGKDLPFSLRFVEWSPDSKLILFVTMDAEVYVYDSEGNKVRAFTIIGQDKHSLGGDSMITSIHWYCPINLSHYHAGNNAARSALPGSMPATLCIAFENGKIQLSRGDDDSTAELIDTDLVTVDFARWSTKGQILAVVGTQKSASGVSTKNAEAKSSSSSTSNVVKFYDNKGKYIRSVKIPGEKINEVSWEGGDLRLALAVDSFIYFANIRHKYTWTYFLNTVVYAYARPERKETAIIFWDLTTQESHQKSLPQNQLRHLVSRGEYCALVIAEATTVSNFSKQRESIKQQQNSNGQRDADDEDGNNTNIANSGRGSLLKDPVIEVYSIQLRNSIGAVVDTKSVPFAPKFVAMSPYHIVAANERTVFTWQYQRSSSRGNNSNNSSGSNGIDLDDMDFLDKEADIAKKSGGNNNSSGSKLRIFDISNIGFSTAQSPETFTVNTESISDPITAVTISDRFLVVGRRSGSLTRFNLPHLTVENSYTLKDREPSRLELNCNSSKCAVVDNFGILNVLDLEVKINPMSLNAQLEEKMSGSQEIGTTIGGGGATSEKANRGGPNPLSTSFLGNPMFGRKLSIEKKDVWDLCWSEDDPDQLAVMEKTKLLIYHHETPEEPVVSSAYLARFKDLQLKVVALDELFQHPDKPRAELVIDYETRLLRDVREKISSEGLASAYEYAERNAHPKLWKLLAIAGLEELDLSIAERCFVRSGDYYGIQLVRQLQGMPDRMKAKAEVAVFLHRFDEAESIYREIDRKDLAISLRKKLGDHQRVIQLLQTGGGNDQLVRQAWDQMGYYYFDRMKWKKAAQHFQLSRNYEQLVECYYRMDAFEELQKLVQNELPDESALLVRIAKRFEAVGMCTEAVQCYLRSMQHTITSAGESAGPVNYLNTPAKDAVDCCVKLHKWDLALELAEKYDFPQVEGLLVKFALQLVQSNRRLEAIELFRVANKPTEAAILIGDLAETVANELANPMLAKKLHVLAALEIERHRKRAIELATGETTNTQKQGKGDIAQATAQTLETLMMTNLLEGGGFGGNKQSGGETKIGATLQMTLNTLATAGGGTAEANLKKASKAFANAWRGAAAYHYYMLAMRQFYAGNMDAAMKTSIKLCEYDDIINPRTIYSLLCICALKNQFYGVCSKAFVKLETLPNINEGERDALQSLAVKIFLNNSPHDPAPLMDAYAQSLDLGRSFHACLLTGRAIQDSPSHLCRTCRHHILEFELETYAKKVASMSSGSSNKQSVNHGLQHCPLCHTPLLFSAAPTMSSNRNK